MKKRIKKPKRLTAIKVLIGFAGFIAFSMIVIFSLLYYLASGAGFSHADMTARLENLLNERLPSDVKTKINEARFIKTDAGLSLVANNIQFLQADKTVFTAPQISLVLDPIAYMKAGAAENSYLKRIEITGAKIDYSPSDTQFDLASFNIAPLGVALQKLRETSFLTVLFKDLTVDTLIIDVALNHVSEKEISINVTEAGKERLKAEVFFADQGQNRVDLTFNETRLADLIKWLPTGYNPERVDLSLKGKARLLLNGKNDPVAFQGDVQLFNGKLVKHGKNPKTYQLNESRLLMSWVEGRDQMTVEQLTLDMHPYKASLKGVVSASGFLVTDGNISVLAGHNDPAVTLSQVMIKGLFDLEKRVLEFERAELAGREAQITLAGKLVFSAETPGVYLNVETKPMPAWVYLRLWPEFIATKSRQWVLDHLKSGTAEASVIKTAIPPGVMIPDNAILDKDMLLIKAKITKGVIKPLDDLGNISANDISLHVDGKNVHVETHAASLDVAGARPLDASLVIFDVPDTGPENPQANVIVKAKGEANSLAVLLKSNSFKDISAFNLDSESQIKGNASLNLMLSMVLKSNLKKTDVKYKADIEFTGFSQKEVVRDLDLDNATVKVTATGDTFFLKGEGRIGGQQASFDYKKEGKKPIIELRAILDEKGRSRFGLASGGRIVGSTPIKIISSSDTEDTFLVEADLTQASLFDLIPGWTKPANVPAKAKLKATDLDPGWKIDDIFIEGRGGVLVRGSLEVDKAGQLLSGNFPTYHLHDGDKANVRIDKTVNGHKVTLAASVIDLRAVLKNLLSSSSPVGVDKSSPRAVLTIEAKVGAAAGNNGEMMRNIAIRATRVGGEIRSVDATGRIGRGAFKIANMQDDRNNWLTVTAGDAGAWLRFFNIYNNLQGGALRLATAPPKADGSISAGAVEITDFAIRGDQAVSGMVATSEIRETRSNLSLEERQRILSERIRERSGQNVTNFTRLKADFSRSATQIIDVRNGLIWGPALGSTIDGTLDFNKNTMNMSGTYVPAYAVNNIFAKLPIIGFFLGGGTDEGLIGVNYTMTGSIAAPQLTINPLSLLAPGFLRRLMDFKGGRDMKMQDTPN